MIGLYQVIQKPLSYLAGVDWANASVINEVIRLKDAMVNLGYNIGNLANVTMEQLANNSQIQLSKWAGIVGTQGTALEGVSGGVHPWVLNFNFLGLDLSNAPSAAFGHIMALDFSNMSVILLLLIPVLAVIASVISMKVTQAQTGQNQNTEGQAAQMTKSMNLMMPVMTAFFTVTLPAGLGLYWAASAIVRCIQQLAINKYLSTKSLDEMIAENQKKAQKKREKHGAPAKEINKMATTSTRNAGKVTKGQSGISESERDSKIQEAQARAQKAKPGSLTSKANLVSRYNQGLETAEPKVESAEKDSKKKKRK